MDEEFDKTKEKKGRKVSDFFKAIFVHNIGIKLLSIALGALLVVLAVAL